MTTQARWPNIWCDWSEMDWHLNGVTKDLLTRSITRMDTNPGTTEAAPEEKKGTDTIFIGRLCTVRGMGVLSRGLGSNPGHIEGRQLLSLRFQILWTSAKSKIKYQEHICYKSMQIFGFTKFCFGYVLVLCGFVWFTYTWSSILFHWHYSGRIIAPIYSKVILVGLLFTKT